MITTIIGSTIGFILGFLILALVDDIYTKYNNKRYKWQRRNR